MGAVLSSGKPPDNGPLRMIVLTLQRRAFRKLPHPSATSLLTTPSQGDIHRDLDGAQRRLRGRLVAGWQSGDAEDCKSFYVGSIPVPASIRETVSSSANVRWQLFLGDPT